ncbi:MAG: response regulator [Campylobacterota bacterium]|nr:response regulator [Campylobacterota bacterium]
MKKIIAIILLLVSFALLSNLSASEYRKIVVATFHNQKDADGALKKLIQYSELDDKLIELQNSEGFEFVSRASGRYFILCVEPFNRGETLKYVASYIRKKHSDAFINKLKISEISIKKTPKKPKEETIKISDVIEVLEPKESPVIRKKVIPVKVVEPPVKEETQVVDPKPIDIPIVKKTKPQAEVKQEILPVETNSQSSRNMFYLFAMTMFFLIVASVLIFISRKENKKLRHHLTKAKEDLEILYDDMTYKEVFLAKISHEVRTPMNAIIGLSHIVLQSDLSHLQRENVSKIKYSGELLLDIINDILDLSKIDAGELKIEKLELNINNVLDHVSNMVSINAKSKNLELIFDIDKNVPSRLIGDPLRLGQVLINLLSNAIKFTQKGEIDLSVHTISQDDKKVLLEFNVRDTGIGMSPSQIAKLFRSFSQGDDTTSRIYGGTGLGLSISKQLIEMMGGGIRVESQYAHGSNFIFTVELEIEDPDNKRHYRLPEKSLMGKTAMIIDTNTKSISALSKMLEYFHYSVQTMPIMQEAESMLKESDFDIIFIDEQKFSKYALESLRKLKNEKEIKIVLIESLYNQTENSSKRYTEIDRYLLKPFNQQSIFNIILEIYGDQQSSKTIQSKNAKDDLKNLKNKHVLVAEDNEINQRVLSGLLDDTGITLSMVENGKEVLEALKKDPKFDLILMDISMPIMDGYEATKRIRTNNEYDTIPIIALTANSMDEEIEHALSCGMQGFIGKPLSVNVLYQTLYDVLKDEPKIPEIQVQKSKSKPQVQEKFLSKSINLEEGIARCAGDTNLFKGILQDFTEMYADSVRVFDSMISDKRYYDGKQFAHDIKGVSANIGASELSSLAAKLEEAFVREHQSNYSILLKNYQESLKRVFQDIEQLKL